MKCPAEAGHLCTERPIGGPINLAAMPTHPKPRNPMSRKERAIALAGTVWAMALASPSTIKKVKLRLVRSWSDLEKWYTTGPVWRLWAVSAGMMLVITVASVLIWGLLFFA